MLKDNTIIQKEYTCDHCGTKLSGDDKLFQKEGWLSLKVMSRLGSRMYTCDKEMIERTIKPYVNEQHFCSKNCISNSLKADVELLIAEIQPIDNRR